MAKVRLKKKVKKTLISIISIIIIAIIGVISINLLLKEEKKVEKKEEKKVEKKEEKKVQIIDLDSNSRPYAVMINNISTVWGYQAGLQDAYVVYEMLVEGGYTRLMALYKDKNLDRIGTVRSSRHYFLDYALEHDAIYVHFGWSTYAQNDIKSLGVNNINFLTYNGYTRDRSLGLSSEHTAFTTTAKIMEGADYYGYRKTTEQKSILSYSVDPIDISKKEGAIAANNVFIKYSNSRNTSFIYDSANKVYKRLQNNIEHKDYVTKQQYTAKNIITYKLPTSTISGDNKGRQNITTVGTGTGYYITNGYAVPIKWTKDKRSSQTKYSYLDGTELKVNDGNTYIQIQPEDKELTIN